MNFASLDFETANYSRVSICAAGLAIFENGSMTESLYWLVRPPKGHGWFREDFTEECQQFSGATVLADQGAMAHRGHNSKAIHRAYARKAQVRLPSLESYEKQNVEGRIVPLLPPLSKPERNGHSISAAG